ncbi:MAG: carboxypeptidase-like regulatory domain-containing protein [Leptolyngbyaceae cyanobacterium bins.302]|nr:carboxypeptidase-like regulatory domain-containing protein [Leptolyngbyaceae cyanobacterium bins.302]
MLSNKIQVNCLNRMRWLSCKIGFPVLLLGTLGQAGSAIAHGVEMQYQTTQAIALQAKYDTGAPFANAQVSVYAPDSDAPWLKGTTNSEGQFTFTPDASKPGTWQVKVRSAGHGEILNIPVSAAQATATTPANPGTGYTSLQKGVMAASVIWGAIGTALFFWGRKR